jgi:hypothetical protein
MPKVKHSQKSAIALSKPRIQSGNKFLSSVSSESDHNSEDVMSSLDSVANSAVASISADFSMDSESVNVQSQQLVPVAFVTTAAVRTARLALAHVMNPSTGDLKPGVNHHNVNRMFVSSLTSSSASAATSSVATRGAMNLQQQYQELLRDNESMRAELKASELELASANNQIQILNDKYANEQKKYRRFKKRDQRAFEKIQYLGSSEHDSAVLFSSFHNALSKSACDGQSQFSAALKGATVDIAKRTSLSQVNACIGAMVDMFFPDDQSAELKNLLPTPESVSNWVKQFARVGLDAIMAEALYAAVYGFVADSSTRHKREVFPIAIYFFNWIRNQCENVLVSVPVLKSKTGAMMAHVINWQLIKKLHLSDEKLDVANNDSTTGNSGRVRGLMVELSRKIGHLLTRIACYVHAIHLLYATTRDFLFGVPHNSKDWYQLHVFNLLWWLWAELNQHYDEHADVLRAHGFTGHLRRLNKPVSSRWSYEENDMVIILEELYAGFILSVVYFDRVFLFLVF